MLSINRFPRKVVRIVALVVVLGVVAWVCTKLLSDSNTESTNDAYVQADFTLGGAPYRRSDFRMYWWTTTSR